jgi:hypothetical protein
MKRYLHTFIQTTLTISLLLCGLRLQAQAGWVTWQVSAGGNGNQFLVVGPSSGLTWNVANGLAQSTYGGYLATITSAAENNFVFGMIDSSQYFTAFNGSGPAIGGYNAGTPSSPNWSWVTGEAFTYSNWSPGQPDYGSFGYGTESRLEYFSGSGRTPSSQWNDIAPTDPNIGGFVVERVAPVPEPDTYALLGLVCAFAVGFRKAVFPRRKNAGN